ncbi:6525_t:CDS:2, partial [Funneliformis mosseae]
KFVTANCISAAKYWVMLKETSDRIGTICLDTDYQIFGKNKLAMTVMENYKSNMGKCWCAPDLGTISLSSQVTYMNIFQA